jgi:cell division protein FtsB
MTNQLDPYYDPIEAEVRPVRRPRILNGTQIMFAIILAVGLMLAINFSSRVSADRELRALRDSVDREIEALQREQSDLIARLAYVQNDAYVEGWARSEGRMVREGEVLLKLFPTTNSVTLPTQPQETFVVLPDEQPQAQPWELWWAMFFDSPPPEF